METGQYIKDGEVTWIVTDIRDTSRAGHITLETELLPGYLKLNGATVTASEYPRLITWQKKQSDAVKLLFIYDESADTLTLPDLRGRFLEGGDSIALMEAGLPNVTGSVWGDGYNNTESLYWNGTGALYSSHRWNSSSNIAQYVASKLGTLISDISFNASKSSRVYGASDTVQPAALTLIPQIKY